jgi:uncharacterized membrane protein YdfJ with MMPL/SSD domain
LPQAPVWLSAQTVGLSDTDTEIAATGLPAGILIDAAVIRPLIVPAVVSLTQP